jgi:hypothetical protein
MTLPRHCSIVLAAPTVSTSPEAPDCARTCSKRSVRWCTLKGVEGEGGQAVVPYAPVPTVHQAQAGEADTGQIP